MDRMARDHHYALDVLWTGNAGTGTSGYRDYSREQLIVVDGKPTLSASADPAFFGDPALHNPEELLLAALSTCHLLSYLALAARAGVTVTSYRDHATATMAENGWGGGRFTRVVLHPEVVVADPATIERATTLHHDANQACFVAASVNFPVDHEPVVRA